MKGRLWIVSLYPCSPITPVPLLMEISVAKNTFWRNSYNWHWTTWVWTGWVHLYMAIFFNSKYYNITRFQFVKLRTQTHGCRAASDTRNHVHVKGWLQVVHKLWTAQRLASVIPSLFKSQLYNNLNQYRNYKIKIVKS